MSRPNPYLTLTAGIIIIGFAAILIRYAEAPGPVTAFYRLAIGSVAITIPFLLRQRKRAAPLSSRGIRFAIAGGLFLAVDMALWSTGIVMSGAAIPTIMVNTAPLWVGLGALLFFREKQTLFFWAGLLVAVAGSVIVLRQETGSSTEIGPGGLLGAIAALFYAGFHLVSQKGRGTLDTAAYIWIVSVSATAALFFINLVLGHSFTGYSPETYANFTLQGVIVHMCGWLLLSYSQGHLPASVMAPSLLGQPIMTAFFAWLLLGEVLSVSQIGGATVVLLGIYMVHHHRRSGRPARASERI